MEVLQHLWATQSSVWPYSWYCFFPFYLEYGIYCVTICVCWLLCHRGTLMKRGWIPFLVLSCSQVASSSKVSFSLSWKYPASSASSCASCSPAPDCLGGLLIDSVACVNIVLVLEGAPNQWQYWDKVLRKIIPLALSLIQLKMLLATLAARAQCWHTFKLSSVTLRSFSASKQLPPCTVAWGYSFPDARTWNCSCGALSE